MFHYRHISAGRDTLYIYGFLSGIYKINDIFNQNEWVYSFGSYNALTKNEQGLPRV